MRKGATSPKLVDGQTYRNQSFRRVDWSNRRFDDVKFYGCTFEDVQFTHVLFGYCTFVDCKFDMVTFNEVHLSGGGFFDSTFRDSELTHVVFLLGGNVSYEEPMLKDCAFHNVGLSHVDFRCTCEGLFFDEADLDHVGGYLNKKYQMLPTETGANRYFNFEYTPMVPPASSSPAAAPKKAAPKVSKDVSRGPNAAAKGSTAFTRFQAALVAAVKKISDGTVRVPPDSVKSREDFKSVDANIGTSVVAVVDYDGNDLGMFFEYDHERYDEIAMMEAEMAKAGFLVEPETHWYAYVYDMTDQKPARPNARKNIRLPGGIARAKRKQLSDFNPYDLRDGQQHELEHTSDVEAATWIAADHLTEDPDYYRKLARLNARKRRN